jgi:uncharacterized membrane protein
MKKIINQIARYILGVWVIVFVLLLVCIFMGENRVDNSILKLAFILFSVVTILLFLTYIIHLIWMIQAKRKPETLKADIISTVFLAIALIGYNAYSNQFAWEDMWIKIVPIPLIFLAWEIARYIYSWKE